MDKNFWDKMVEDVSKEEGECLKRGVTNDICSL